jgi:hypothetical protein
MVDLRGRADWEMVKVKEANEQWQRAVRVMSDMVTIRGSVHW